MGFFLKYVNPLLALGVLVICLISASTNDDKEFVGFFGDPFQTYFLAKGIFCSTALFLLGKLVEQGLARKGARSDDP
jgi:hypothetical protein